jgi:SAM-dependent methyltransferase
LLAVTPLGRDLSFHVLPLRWTGEAARLAAALQIDEDSAVADIGAGNGALIAELARIVGPGGRAYATERTVDQRTQIAERAAVADLTWLTVLEAGEHVTNLPDSCCDAITMRMVWHHIADPPRFAVALRRALRQGGRVGIIDFAPGDLPHLADDHGVRPDDLIAAFSAAGFVAESLVPDWGGRSYLMTFTLPSPPDRR